MFSNPRGTAQQGKSPGPVTIPILSWESCVFGRPSPIWQTWLSSPQPRVFLGGSRGWMVRHWSIIEDFCEPKALGLRRASPLSGRRVAPGRRPAARRKADRGEPGAGWRTGRLPAVSGAPGHRRLRWPPRPCRVWKHRDDHLDVWRVRMGARLQNAAVKITACSSRTRTVSPPRSGWSRLR